LDSSDPKTESQAIIALGRAGPVAKIAVPQLIGMLRKEMDIKRRLHRPPLFLDPLWTIATLTHIDCHIADQAYSQFRVQSLSSTLAAIGPQASNAVPLLREIRRREPLRSGVGYDALSDLLRMQAPH
jgi:hypothetical protein